MCCIWRDRTLSRPVMAGSPWSTAQPRWSMSLPLSHHRLGATYCVCLYLARGQILILNFVQMQEVVPSQRLEQSAPIHVQRTIDVWALLLALVDLAILHSLVPRLPRFFGEKAGDEAIFFTHAHTHTHTHTHTHAYIHTHMHTDNTQTYTYTHARITHKHTHTYT